MRSNILMRWLCVCLVGMLLSLPWVAAAQHTWTVAGTWIGLIRGMGAETSSVRLHIQHPAGSPTFRGEAHLCTPAPCFPRDELPVIMTGYFLHKRFFTVELEMPNHGPCAPGVF